LKGNQQILEIFKFLCKLLQKSIFLFPSWFFQHENSTRWFQIINTIYLLSLKQGSTKAVQVKAQSMLTNVNKKNPISIYTLLQWIYFTKHRVHCSTDICIYMNIYGIKPTPIFYLPRKSLSDRHSKKVWLWIRLTAGITIGLLCQLQSLFFTKKISVRLTFEVWLLESPLVTVSAFIFYPYNTNNAN
jgi:hypothetical protein